MVELYDREAIQIYDICLYVQNKYTGRTDNGENLGLLKKELEDRLLQAGYVASVNPLLEPVEVVIEARVEQREFDRDEKAWEIRKSRDQGGI